MSPAKKICTNLNINISNLVLRSDDGPAHHRREYESREVAASVTTFYELETE